MNILSNSKQMKIKILLSISVFVILFSTCKKDEENQIPTELENTIPIFSDINNQTVTAGVTDSVGLIAVDGDSDLLTFSIITNPGFLSIMDFSQTGNTATAKLLIEPNEEITGNFNTTILVEDNQGGADSVSFMVEVNEPIVIVVDSTILKQPNINLINSPDYFVESSYIAKSRTTSSYIYGLIKINYSGFSDRNYVKMDADFKDSEGNIIYSDYTFLDQPNVAWGGHFNSNSFVTPTFNIGYFKIIENLGTYNAELSDIASIDIVITSISFTYAPAEGQMSKQGEPYRVETDSWYQDIIIDGNINIEISFGTFLFIDHLEREYKWTFCDTYKWNNTNQEYLIAPRGTILEIGEYGYSQALSNTPDYLGSNYLNLSAICLDWDVPSKKSGYINEEEIISSLTNRLKNESLSIFERNKLIKETRDKIIELQTKL
jgi:hypothetical protein